MDNFDYKKYLVENKLTAGSRLSENVDTLQWPNAIRNFITTNLSSDEKELYLVVKALEKTLESFKNEMGEFDPDFHYTNEDMDSTSKNKLTTNSRLSETTTDNVSDYDDGIYIAIDKKPTPEMQVQIAKEANKKFSVDMKKIKFEENPNTGDYSVFIPFAGDYYNMLDVLEKFGIGKLPYTSPHLR
jgi:Sec-independent protein translocase protein TatA